ILAPDDDLVRRQIHDGGPPHMGVALVVHPQAALVGGEVAIIDDGERGRGTRGKNRNRFSNDDSAHFDSSSWDFIPLFTGLAFAASGRRPVPRGKSVRPRGA